MKKLLQKYNEDEKVVLREIDSIAEQARKEDRLMNDSESEKVQELHKRQRQIRADRTTLIEQQQWREEDEERNNRSVQDPSVIADREEREIENKRDSYNKSVQKRERVFSNWGEILITARAVENKKETAEMRSKIAECEKRAATGMSEEIDADGGILLEPDVAADLLEGTEKTSRLWGRMERRPIRGNSIKIPAEDEKSRANGQVCGGIGVYPVGEADTYQLSSLKTRKVGLELKKIGCYVAATDEELQDIVGLEARIANKVPMAFALELDRYAIDGNGANVPHGFMKDANIRHTQALDAGQDDATPIKVINLTQMKSHILPGRIKSYVWLAGHGMTAQLPLLTIGNSPVYLPAGTIATSQSSPLLLGIPIIDDFEYCEELNTEGDLILVAIGEMVRIDKGSMDMRSSVHVRFLNDEQIFKFTYRCDARMPFKNKVTAAKGAHEYAPVITLNTRA